MKGLLLAAAFVLGLILPVAASEPPSQSPQNDVQAMFEGGESWDQFVARLEVVPNGALEIPVTDWKTNIKRAVVAPELVRRFRSAGAHLRMLVVSRISCSDSAHTLPYIAKLASGAGVSLRVTDLKARPLLDSFRTADGRVATPTVLLIRDARIVGGWVEQPEPLRVWWAKARGRLGLLERFRRRDAWYDWDRGETTLEEIVSLAEMASARSRD